MNHVSRINYRVDKERRYKHQPEIYVSNSTTDVPKKNRTELGAENVETQAKGM